MFACDRAKAATRCSFHRPTERPRHGGRGSVTLTPTRAGSSAGSRSSSYWPRSGSSPPSWSLVDSETWLRVQTQLDAKNAADERPQKYDLYLTKLPVLLLRSQAHDRTAPRQEWSPVRVLHLFRRAPQAHRCTRPRSSLSGSSSASKSHTTPTASQRT